MRFLPSTPVRERCRKEGNERTQQENSACRRLKARFTLWEETVNGQYIPAWINKATPGSGTAALNFECGRESMGVYETFSELKKAGFGYFKIDFLFSAAMDGARSQRMSPIQA